MVQKWEEGVFEVAEDMVGDGGVEEDGVATCRGVVEPIMQC